MHTRAGDPRRVAQRVLRQCHPATGARRGARSLRRWVAVATISALLVACGEDDVGPAFSVTNDLEEDVHVTVGHAGSETTPVRDARLDPGGSGYYALVSLGRPNEVEDGWCTDGDIVARDDDGVELARVPPPVCGGAGILLSEHATDPSE